MREIKFRGKSVETGKWEYGNLVITDHNRLYEMIDNERRYRGVIAFETVGQFTGLHDKNGKEIYEGDIIQEVYIDRFDNNKERRYGKYVVEYDIDRAGYIPFACGDGCGCCETHVISIEHAEVIGNIYDNPELLGGKDE